MAAMPADPNALTFDPRSNVLAHCIDATRDFMTRDARILKPRPETFFDQRIAVANTACLNLHTYFASTRFRDIALYQLPIPAGLTYLRCVHFRIHKCSSGLITLGVYCERLCIALSNNGSQEISPNLQRPGVFLR